ncbi:hypothetical protein P421_06965 [Heyndrickxia coagulans P38]|nr:hypothetical protein P421_06965 [Heyndrickxia coagulans P38]
MLRKMHGSSLFPKQEVRRKAEKETGIQTKPMPICCGKMSWHSLFSEVRREAEKETGIQAKPMPICCGKMS